LGPHLHVMTYSSQNVRQIWESTLSKSDYLVVHASAYLKIFFTFLQVNTSNILWSMRICKRTFFPVCRMSGYVNTLVYFYLAYLDKKSPAKNLQISSCSIATISYVCNYKVQFCALKGDAQNLPLRRVGRGEISPLAVPRG
jgi:hypothetical protein